MEDIFANAMENMGNFEDAKEKNGSIEVVTGSRKVTVAPNNGEGGHYYQDKTTEIALTQQAYIDGPADGTPIYKATGIDQHGNNYEVTWEVVENWEQIEDEQEMCDWDQPARIEKI